MVDKVKKDKKVNFLGKSLIKKEGKKEEKPKKKAWTWEKQSMVLFGVLMVVFLVFIGAAYLGEKFKDKGDSFEYNDFTVHKARLEGTTVDFYFIPINVIGVGEAVNVMFRSDPRDVENISLSLGGNALGGISKVWITTSPEYDSAAVIAQGEIGRMTAAVAITTGYALTEEVGEFPKKTCKDATDSVRVIDIRVGNETRVYSESEGNCIVVEADNSEDTIKAADKLAYYWLEQLFIKKIDYK